MFCKKCGNPIEDTIKFCPKCGQQVNAADGSVRQQESEPKTKSTLKAKIIVGVLFVVIVVAFFELFGYKYSSQCRIKRQTAQMIELCINKIVMAKRVQFVKVEVIDLVKHDGNHYSGTAWVCLKHKGNAEQDPARFKYVLNVDIVGDQINFSQKIHRTDLLKFAMFVFGGGEKENEGEKEEDNESANSIEESAAESDEERTISSFLGFEFGTEINELCKPYMTFMNSSKEEAFGSAKLKKPFRMFETDSVDFRASPTTKRMYDLSISSVLIPDVAVRRREYEKCRDIIQRKYGIKPKESCEESPFGFDATSEFAVGNVTIILKNLVSGCLVLSATNTKLEKEAKEEYKASLPSGDDEDAL